MDMRLSIICREIDKNTGAIATYLCKNNINDNDLMYFQTRAMFNPELTYYSVLSRVAEDSEELEEVLSFLKRRNLTDAAIEQYGGIVKL